MGTVENVCSLAVQIADDNTHGYSQYNRDGNPDFDCSSLVIYLWESNGVPVREYGATYTGNMLDAFLACGFRKISAANEFLVAGDVLLNVKHHTALYIGNGKLVQATIAENGTIHGNPGDQTGTEIGIFSYYDYPWDYVLRYEPDQGTVPYPGPSAAISYSDADCIDTEMPILQRGEWGPAVAAIQGMLKYHGFFDGNEISGFFGVNTETALLSFQKKHGLETNGVCGPKTWNELSFWR